MIGRQWNLTQVKACSFVVANPSEVLAMVLASVSNEQSADEKFGRIWFNVLVHFRFPGPRLA
jgi:malate/lactate dehydrogenase